VTSFDLPAGMTLEQFLGQHEDTPLPNIAGFDRLREDTSPHALRKLNDWIEPQSVCNTIIRWHGAAGLARVLKGIARASAEHGVTMSPRVRAMAGALGLQVL
jgi:hypothetical protein